MLVASPAAVVSTCSTWPFVDCCHEVVLGAKTRRLLDAERSGLIAILALVQQDVGGV